jgi:hypothetical protein
MMRSLREREVMTVDASSATYTVYTHAREITPIIIAS